MDITQENSLSKALATERQAVQDFPTSEFNAKVPVDLLQSNEAHRDRNLPGNDKKHLSEGKLEAETVNFKPQKSGRPDFLPEVQCQEQVCGYAMEETIADQNDMSMEEALAYPRLFSANKLKQGEILTLTHNRRAHKALGLSKWEEYSEIYFGLRKAQAYLIIGSYEVSKVTGLQSDNTPSFNALNEVRKAFPTVGKNSDKIKFVHRSWKRVIECTKARHPDLNKVTADMVRKICEEIKLADYLMISREKMESDALSPIVSIDKALQKEVANKVLDELEKVENVEGIKVDSESQPLLTREFTQMVVDSCKEECEIKKSRHIDEDQLQKDALKKAKNIEKILSKNDRNEQSVIMRHLMLMFYCTEEGREEVLTMLADVEVNPKGLQAEKANEEDAS